MQNGPQGGAPDEQFGYRALSPYPPSPAMQPEALSYFGEPFPGAFPSTEYTGLPHPQQSPGYPQYSNSNSPPTLGAMSMAMPMPMPGGTSMGYPAPHFSTMYSPYPAPPPATHFGRPLPQLPPMYPYPTHPQIPNPQSHPQSHPQSMQYPQNMQNMQMRPPIQFLRPQPDSSLHYQHANGMYMHQYPPPLQPGYLQQRPAHLQQQLAHIQPHLQQQQQQQIQQQQQQQYQLQQQRPQSPLPPTTSSAPPTKPKQYAEARYEFGGDSDEFLMIAKGDRIEILGREEDNYFLGRNTRTGEEGTFPAKYVKMLGT